MGTITDTHPLLSLVKTTAVLPQDCRFTQPVNQVPLFCLRFQSLTQGLKLLHWPSHHWVLDPLLDMLERYTEWKLSYNRLPLKILKTLTCIPFSGVPIKLIVTWFWVKQIWFSLSATIKYNTGPETNRIISIDWNEDVDKKIFIKLLTSPGELGHWTFIPLPQGFSFPPWPWAAGQFALIKTSDFVLPSWLPPSLYFGFPSGHLTLNPNLVSCQLLPPHHLKPTFFIWEIELTINTDTWVLACFSS